MALEGATLKGWKLNKKLGAGACSDVYAVESVAPLHDKNCSAFVMKLSPLVAVDAAKAKNKKRKKSAAERNADALYAEHLMYQSHLRDHDGLPYIPQGAYGEDKGFRFLVMERLGRTLDTVVQENGPIPSATAAQLGLDLLETLQHIHSKNIVYVDVKPENFMLDRDKENRVYIVDFGIADRYIMATGKHKEFKTGAIVGTPTYLSLNCHGGATASRRDDVEALLHVLIYLLQGELPWQNTASDAEGAKIKKETSIKDLCDSLPSEWATMLSKARDCGFEDRPEYDFFSKMFVKLGAKRGAKDPFAWGTKKSKPQAAATARGDTSPARKKSKCEDRSPTPGPAPAPAAKAKAKPKPKAAVKKAVPPTVATKTPSVSTTRAKSTRASPRETKSRASPKTAAAATKTTKKATGASDDDDHDEEDNEEESDGVEFVKTAGKDPRRRRKAAQQAVAAAAAAEAAAKQAEGTGRYQLRSRSTSR